MTQTDKLYTGQQQEPGDALGLYDYKARFYSTVLGRFLGVDPVAGSVADPQSWNAFTYVRNNPLRYSDPTGARWDSDIEADEEAYRQQREHDDLVAALLYLAATQPRPGDVVTADVGIRPAPLPVPVPFPDRLSPEEVQAIEEFVTDVGGTFADAASTVIDYATTDGNELPEGVDAEPVPVDPEIDREARRIARGHAGAKHADEFPDAQGSEELAGRVAEIIRNPSAVKHGARGRTAYWDEDSGTIVITDPNNPDGGTVFRPTNGREYFDDEFN